MNKKRLLVLPLLVLLVTGCKDKVNELYPKAAYESTEFVENYYTTWNNDLVNNVASTVDIDISSYAKIDIQQRNASGINPSLNYIRAEDQINPQTKEYLDWYRDTPVEDKGIGYGPTKNLTSIDKSFAYGFLSKLYDGRIQCDGLYQKSRVQLSDVGYGTLFPKQLESAKYLALAMRGGTTCERSFSNTNDPATTGVTIDFTVSLYSYDFSIQKYTKYNYIYNDMPLLTNAGGHTQLLSFYFDETSLKKVPDNVTGMSMTFTLNKAAYPDLITDVETYKNSSDKHLLSLMLYEVLIPDSSWK